MPYFLDVDFYSQTASVRSTLVNNALLPVPANVGGWRDRFQIPDLLMSFYGNPFPKEEIEIEPSKDIALSLVQDVSFQVEDFERDDLLNCMEEEIIPSSCPESDSSSQFVLDPEMLKRSLVEGVKDGDALGSALKFETFTQQRNEGYQELEVPIMRNAFSQSLSKLTVYKTILKRLQVLPADDPLLKPDKTPWTEKDFFEDSHQQLPFEAHSSNEWTVEDYRDYSVGDTIRMEEFLIPVVKINDRFHMLLEDFHNLMSLKDKLGCLQQSCSIDDIAEANNECLNFGTISVDSLDNIDLSSHLADIDPPSDFTKEESPDPTFCDKSPVFGFPTKRAPHRPESVLNYFSNSCWKEKLDPFKEGEVSEECPLLTKKEYKKLKLELWESEKHFDEERLQEPCLPKQELPNTFEAAKQLFPLSPEMDSIPHCKDSADPGLHEQFRCMEDPSKEIALTGYDLELPTLPSVETFAKTVMSFNDGWLNEITDEIHPEPSPSLPNGAHHENAMSKDNVPRDPENHQQEDHQSDCFVGGGNPLDFFMQFRSHSTEISSGPEVKQALPKCKIKEELCELQKSNAAKTSVNATVTEEDVVGDRPICVTDSNVVKVPFAGSHEEALKCLEDFVVPFFDKVKQKGLIPHDQPFYATSVDDIRFLMKENVVQSRTLKNSESDVCSSDTSDLTQSLNILLRIRQALHLLVHSCLPSAIHHIASFNQSSKENGPSCTLQERLLQLQYSFQQQNILHPKFDTLVNYLNEEDQHKNTILIVVQQGLMSLVSDLERILAERTSHKVEFTKTLENDKTDSDRTSRVVISFGASLNKASLEPFDPIIQFDVSKSTEMKDLCEEMGKQYLGLVSEYKSTSGHSGMAVSSDKMSKKTKLPFTVIGSVEMMQHRQLVYTLEARHNILFIERNYNSLQLSQPVPHADVIFGLEVSLVLLPLLEMGTGDWDMEEFTKRVIAVGLQAQHCFVLVHGIGGPSKYPLDKTVLQSLYRLRSCLSNLSSSSASFVAQYKVKTAGGIELFDVKPSLAVKVKVKMVNNNIGWTGLHSSILPSSHLSSTTSNRAQILTALTQEDVVTNISAIAEYSKSKSSHDEDGRQWLTADVSQDEAFLLQMVCLNSFSAQLLLSKLNLVDILTMPPKQIKENFPNFPDSVIMYLQHLTSRLRTGLNSSSSSQVSARSISQKSACSSSPNSHSDVVMEPLSPLSIPTISSKQRKVPPFSSAPHPSKSVNVSQGTVESHNTDLNTDTFNTDPNHVRRKGGDHNYRVSNQTVEISNRAIDEGILKSHRKGHENYIDPTEQDNGDQRKRALCPNDKDDDCPPKRVYHSFDIDKRLVKGERARRRQARTDNLVVEMCDNGDMGMHGHGRNVIEICCQPEANQQKTGIVESMNLGGNDCRASRMCRVQESHSDINSKPENYYFPYSTKQEKSSPLQMCRGNDDDDGQALFFLGQSQSSPHVTSRFENDDEDDETSIIVVKSQEPQSLHRNAEFCSNVRAHSNTDIIIDSILSDPPNGTSTLVNPNTHSPSSCLPVVYPKPLSPSVVKPLPVSDDYAMRLNQNSIKPSPLIHENTTPSSSKYGIFSAKAARKVLPMPVHKSVNPSTTMHDSQNSSPFQDASVNSSDLYSKPVGLPDVTQLPFSVSWDLRKHIKQSQCNVFGKNNKFDSSLPDGAVYGERISRVPFASRDQGDTQGMDMNPTVTQHTWHNMSSSSHNRDFKTQPCPSPPQNKSETNLNHTSVVLPYNLATDEIRSESHLPVFRKSDSHAYENQDNAGYNLKSVRPSSRPLCRETSRSHQRTDGDSNVLNTHYSEFVNDPDGRKENQPRHYLNNADTNFRSENNIIPSTLSSLREHESKHHINMKNPNGPQYYNPPLSDMGELPKQTEMHQLEFQRQFNDANPKFNQLLCSKSHDNIDENALMNFNRMTAQSYETNRLNVHPSLQRLNHPLQAIQTQGSSQDSIRGHSNMTNYGHQRNGSSSSLSSDLYDRTSTSSSHINVLDREAQNRILRVDTDRYSTHASRSHINTYEGRISNLERINPVRDYNLYSDRHSDRPLPQRLPTNTMRLCSLPYTPRRNISVGLAQPLQRSQENPSNASSMHPNRCGSNTAPTLTGKTDSFTRHHHQDQHRSLPQQPLPHTQVTRPTPSSSSSPPMDLVDTLGHQPAWDHHDRTTHMANKMKKWNNHLQKHAAQRFKDDQGPQRGEFPLLRQKRLCMEKGGDTTNGQMVLVFK